MVDVKNTIKQKYGKIASEVGNTSCGCSCSGSETSPSIDYPPLGDLGIANLGLGCGVPTDHADEKEGMTVLDLGSGAGIDVFIASKSVGVTGRVIGLDMTEQMITRARENALKLHISNVEFRLGEIEHMPVDSNSIDRVISNCVINLVPDKPTAFAEIYRVLKPGGSFIISDLVTTGTIPQEVRSDMELWAGCVAGAMDRQEYMALIQRVGFKDVQLLSEKPYDQTFSKAFGIVSVTVKGTK
ncbi:MAG: arsenite methyltransferase [Ignavibacteriales bacterium]|nr:arsenite methyltransferase [Ignavibacteriales bacterium]